MLLFKKCLYRGRDCTKTWKTEDGLHIL